MPVRTSDVEGVDMVILPPVRDLGDGFSVRRALPVAQRRMIGPFIFFDQMGPATLNPGEGLDVRPHPHIGLSTVTYLLEGEIFHRDSLGYAQAIRPGEVNWMTAGSGIVHSERTAPEKRAQGSTLFGLQTWVALPAEYEEVAPSFTHYSAEAIPVGEAEGVRIALVAGEIDGMKSPVKTLSDTIYADIVLAGGASYAIKPAYTEQGIYVVSGEVAVAGQTGNFAATELVVFKPGAEIVLTATDGPARLMLLGGEPLPEPRHIYWNFVSSRPERIEQAKADWKAQRFAHVAGESEFIPLPA